MDGQVVLSVLPLAALASCCQMITVAPASCRRSIFAGTLIKLVRQFQEKITLDVMLIEAHDLVVSQLLSYWWQITKLNEAMLQTEINWWLKRSLHRNDDFTDFIVTKVLRSVILCSWTFNGSSWWQGWRLLVDSQHRGNKTLVLTRTFVHMTPVLLITWA